MSSIFKKHFLYNRLKYSIRANDMCIVFIYRASLLRGAFSGLPIETPIPGLLELAKDYVKGARSSFRHAQCLKGCTSQFLDVLSPKVQRRLCVPGQCLILEGSTGSTSYILERGSLDIIVGGTKNLSHFYHSIG